MKKEDKVDVMSLFEPRHDKFVEHIWNDYG
mgnify:CR=1 FL=1